jgi:hypothetical protein
VHIAPLGHVPLPSLHGTPLQHSAAVVHCCPTRAQTPASDPPAPLVAPELPEPLAALPVVAPVPEPVEPLDPDVSHGPHLPCVLPTATSHVSPTQQSALTAHGPHFGTQEFW